MAFDETIEGVRDRLFPGWWLQSKSGLKCEGPVPSYRIECNTLEEYQLARLAKPEYIRADIVYEPNLGRGSRKKRS